MYPVFTQKSIVSPLQLYKKNVQISATNGLKLLRVNLNKHLNWSYHMNILKEKSCIRLNIICELSNQAQKAKLNIIMQTYKSLVVFVIGYGIIRPGIGKKSD